MGANAKTLESNMISWLSEARYSTYRLAAAEDDEAAFALYQWNVGLAQALLRDVSFFRNSFKKCV